MKTNVLKINGVLNIAHSINGYGYERYVIKPITGLDGSLDKKKFNSELIKYAQKAIESEGFFSEQLDLTMIIEKGSLYAHISEKQYLILFLKMCMEDCFEVENKKEFISDFITPIRHKVKANTLQDFFTHLKRTRFFADALNHKKLDVAIELISYVIDDIVLPGSFKYRENKEAFTILEKFAKREYSFNFISNYEYSDEEANRVYQDVLMSLLKHAHAQESLLEKRLGYTALDLAAFKENNIFINCALSNIEDISPYMTKGNIAEYQIKNKNIEQTINSSYEKTALTKVLKIDAVEPSSLVAPKSRSKI